MANRTSTRAFVVKNALVWLLMTVILVIVPDQLRRWAPDSVANVLGWAVACAVWVVAVEPEWKSRVGPGTRFVAELVLWVSAALVAMWIGDQVN